MIKYFILLSEAQGAIHVYITYKQWPTKIIHVVQYVGQYRQNKSLTCNTHQNKLTWHLLKKKVRDPKIEKNIKLLTCTRCTFRSVRWFSSYYKDNVCLIHKEYHSLLQVILLLNRILGRVVSPKTLFIMRINNKGVWDTVFSSYDERCMSTMYVNQIWLFSYPPLLNILIFVFLDAVKINSLNGF